MLSCYLKKITHFLDILKDGYLAGREKRVHEDNDVKENQVNKC